MGIAPVARIARQRRRTFSAEAGKFVRNGAGWGEAQRSPGRGYAEAFREDDLGEHTGMSGQKIDAQLALRSDGRFLVGRERIKLLEAVAECGSITKAAKMAGFSYKTAWEAVDAINNLLPSPAFITKSGGRAGGGAEVTEQGRRLIATFHRLEGRLSEISTLIAAEGFEGHEPMLLWSLGIKISARNVFQTEVTRIQKWPVDVEVSLKMSDGHTILATVTNDAALDLGLTEGRPVLALIKSTFIHLELLDPAPEKPPQLVRRHGDAAGRRRTQQRGLARHRPRQDAEGGGSASGRRGPRPRRGGSSRRHVRTRSRHSRRRLTWACSRARLERGGCGQRPRRRARAGTSLPPTVRFCALPARKRSAMPA